MQRKNSVLLDTSCLLALADKEKGWEVVRDIREDASVSMVNLSEFVSILAKRGMDSDEIEVIISELAGELREFTRTIACLAGKLIVHTKKYGLSFGDRACIATGIIHKIPIYTADTIWANLDLDCDIRSIR